jgi:DNA mismatch repair protein MutH
LSKLLGNNNFDDFKFLRLSEYDDEDVESIYNHSKKLINHSIKDLYPVLIKKAEDGGGLNRKNKGLLGQLVELYHFGKKPDNKPTPDFPNAGENGVELKCTGLKDKDSAKEPLRITKINLERITFSQFINKASLIMLVLYDWEKNTYMEDFIVSKTKMFDLKNDMSQKIYLRIKKDYETILKCLRNGDIKNHRKKTSYIEAKTQDSKQSDERAFYFKESFLDIIIAGTDGYKETFTNEDIRDKTVQEAIVSKLSPYFGAEESILMQKFDVSNRSKQYGYILVHRILGLGNNEKSLEYKLANISVKTIDIGALRKEQMSFKQIDFVKMNEERNFEESEFYELVSANFLFIIFDRNSRGNKFLKDVKPYSLSEDELEEVKKVWIHTKNKIKSGIYDEFMLGETPYARKKSRARNPIAHIRTKDKPNKKTGKYKPVMTPQGLNPFIIKHCLWLNRNFINSIIN